MSEKQARPAGCCSEFCQRGFAGNRFNGAHISEKHGAMASVATRGGGGAGEIRLARLTTPPIATTEHQDAVRQGRRYRFFWLPDRDYAFSILIDGQEIESLPLHAVHWDRGKSRLRSRFRNCPCRLDSTNRRAFRPGQAPLMSPHPPPVSQGR